ncbi:nuclear pore complex protein DDB_G0274915 isoform X2 [Salmo trutta]|uniref:nuclear pore complex protein DDB_G0274915 isoform X2 n=1 Tax=Salmo trutta TaxID=8032 RepID=UPI0011302792|nr:nuclear pore complex protein DDB_G0274915-like isoform X2 [Salmo trutta]
MASFIPDMAGHLFLVILLFVTFQYIEAQGHYPKPDIMVHIDEYFNIICLIPGSVSPGTICNLYVGEESQPSFTAKIKKRKKNSASGHQFCPFTPKHSDLISRLQSVRSKEVSCDYRVSSGPNSISPRSDGYSCTDLVGVHISDPTTKPFSAGSTVSSTLTPNTPVRPTTYRPTKILFSPGLTSPLTPSTALNPSSGSTLSSTLTTDTPSKGLTSPLTPSTALNPSSGSTLSSTLTTDTPSKGLTSPLTPSTAVNPTSGGQSSTESVLAGLTVTSTLTPDITVRPTRGQSSTDSVVADSTAPLTLAPDITVRPTTTVQLWQAVVGVASGVGVFLMGLTAVCLCRRTKKHSQRPTTRQDDHSQCDLVMGAMSSAGMLDSRDAGIYSLITSVPSTFLPSGPVEENGQSSEKDNSDTYHVYSSIPDRPSTSAQPDGLYSLLQTH